MGDEDLWRVSLTALARGTLCVDYGAAWSAAPMADAGAEETPVFVEAFEAGSLADLHEFLLPDGWYDDDGAEGLAAPEPDEDWVPLAFAADAPAPPVVPAVAPPRREDALAPVVRRSGRRGRRSAAVAAIACTLVAAVGWHFVVIPEACRVAVPAGMDVSDRLAVDAVVGQIIGAESGYDPSAKNKLSSATGAGQFLDQTWLEMIRRHRPDLAGQDEAAILDLRRDPGLAREMVTRFAERNAANLISHCLPVTAGTLYLSHFAGGAGAAALLLATDDADAATVMAEADSTGRTTREKLVTANPFLASFTVADIKDWADRKMAADYRAAAIAAATRTQ